MKWYLRIIVILNFAFAGFCLLAQAIGRRLPNTVIAYTEACDNFSVIETYIADWRRGLRISLPETVIYYLLASWSPDGRQLTYVVDLGIGNRWIYVRDLENRSTRILIDKPYQENMPPSWSPNGHSIAITSDGEFAVVDTITNQIQLFPLHSAELVPISEWSPDGNSFIVSGVSPDKNRELYILNLVSNKIQNLTGGQFEMSTFPAWSPSGRYITFTASKSSIIFVYLADLQTHTISQLGSLHRGSTSPASTWSPDGQTIAVVTPEVEVLLYDLKGNLQEKITAFQEIPGLGINISDFDIQWSPDGQYLTVSMIVNHQWGNYVFDFATGTVNSLSLRNCSDTTAVWRPEPPA